MPSYSSISEAWGTEFKHSENNMPHNSVSKDNFVDISDNTELFVKPSDNEFINEMNIEEMDDFNINKSNYSNSIKKKEKNQENIESVRPIDPAEFNNYTLDKCNCTQLLKEVLKCKECQKIIYDNIKDQFQSSVFPSSINNNDILNSVLIGFFIILVLDLFVKIGKLFSR
jgi:hypothetical protein